MDALIARAEEMGLYVAFRDLGRANGYLLGGNLVVINYRRAPAKQRVTLAHEMGHWWHGHDWTRDHDRERDERQADLYASRLLITSPAYAAAEQLMGEHPGAIARELGVTRRLVELWREDRGRSILATVEAWRVERDSA